MDIVDELEAQMGTVHSGAYNAMRKGAAEITRLRSLALRHIPHAYEGDCPDELDRTRRDKGCAACQILGPNAPQKGDEMSEHKQQAEAADGQSHLTDLLATLADAGCYPCVAYRGGGFWRAHINGAGNFWDEAKTPEEALNAAFRLWDQKGRPINGYGSMANA